MVSFPVWIEYDMIDTEDDTTAEIWARVNNCSIKLENRPIQYVH